MKALPAIIGAILATGISAAAIDGNPLGFVQTNWAGLAPARVPAVSHGRSDGQRARIHAATTAAAQRHGIPEVFLHRLTMRESGYRFVQGPPTKWGRAQGPHQILCGTARELGEHDCSVLMRDAERSADLAARYVKQGYLATGSWHGAAAYYHGGPNRRLWGRKTNAYAAAVAPIRVASRDAPFNTAQRFGQVELVPSNSFAVASLR